MLDLDDVTRGVIDAALWTDCEPLGYDPENGERGGLKYLTLDTESTVRIRALVENVVGAIHDEVLEYYVDEREFSLNSGTLSEYFGHDLYLTSVGHGTGFWDRGLGPVGDYLTDRVTELAGALEHVTFYQTDEGMATLDGLN